LGSAKVVEIKGVTALTIADCAALVQSCAPGFEAGHLGVQTVALCLLVDWNDSRG
jgi:hypothetical protein